MKRILSICLAALALAAGIGCAQAGDRFGVVVGAPGALGYRHGWHAPGWHARGWYGPGWSVAVAPYYYPPSYYTAPGPYYYGAPAVVVGGPVYRYPHYGYYGWRHWHR